MMCNEYRPVCLKDLKNYLRKDEYLAGFTEVELAEIRKNIGTLNEKEILNLIKKNSDFNFVELDYITFKQLIDNKELIPGSIYSVNDFQSIYSSNVFDKNGKRLTWGLDVNPSKVYTLLCKALSTSTIDRQVTLISENSSKWRVEYDPTLKILEDGIKNKGTIIYLKDDNNNEAYYNFKDIKNRRYKKDLNALNIIIDNDYVDLYTFNTSNFLDASNSYNVHDNKFNANCYNNVFIGNNCYNNTFENNFYNNSFSGSCTNNLFQSGTTNNIIRDDFNNVIGNFSNLTLIDKNYTGDSVDKQIIRTKDNYVVTYFDPITLTTQVFKL